MAWQEGLEVHLAETNLHLPEGTTDQTTIAYVEGCFENEMD